MVEADEDQEKPDSNTVTVEKQKTEEIPYINVFQWSKIRTGEEASVFDTFGEITMELERHLFFTLKNTEGNLICVIGPIGSGKTTLCRRLEDKLRFSKPGSKTHLKKLLIGKEKLGCWTHESVGKNPDTGKQLSYKRWNWESDDVTDILLDLSDYTKSSGTFMNRALTAIHDWWWHRCRQHGEEIQKRIANVTPLPNIVFFLQEEGPQNHFFINKCERIYLKPFSTEDLLKIYKIHFKSYDPFTEDALIQIATLSQGNPRHYKEYISECLKRYLERKLYEINAKITIEDVKEWISKDMILESMKYKLMELFPRSKEKQIKAVTVLQWLREHGCTSQNTITQKLFDGHKMAASRILNKLETFNYIKSEEHGREKTWTPI